jgi:hypothetical protein
VEHKRVVLAHNMFGVEHIEVGHTKAKAVHTKAVRIEAEARLGHTKAEPEDKN